MTHTPASPYDQNNALRSKLLELEQGFWSNGPQYYRENLSSTALMVFEGMAGLFPSEEVAETIKDDARWRDVKIEVKALLQPSLDFVLLAYMASATGPDGRPYSALVSSGYAREGYKWALAFHQQTPMRSD